MTSTGPSFLFNNRSNTTDGIRLNLNHMGSNHMNSILLGAVNPPENSSTDQLQHPALLSGNVSERGLKTPVSLLNEICAKGKSVPVFGTTESGPVHDRIYECSVKVERGGMMWEGTGQAKTKKDAKQEAAKALLLSMDDKVNRLLIPAKEPIQHELPALEHDPDVPGNPVGELNDICLKIKRLPPEYEEVREEGKPHERVYTLACKLGSQIVEEGRGRSKKHAKKVAAHKVKQRLLDAMSQAGGVNLIKDEEENIADKLQALALLNKSKTIMESGESWRLADWIGEFKQRSGDKLLSLQDKGIIASFDNAKLLREVAEEQKFKVDYLDIEEADEDDQFSCVVSIGIKPVAIFLGRGGSKTQARKSAAVKAVEFLRIAIRN